MFKKIATGTFLFLTLLCHTVQAQDRATPDPKIRALKVEFVTGRMSLTQQQTQRFLPLYHRYSDELLFVKRKIKNLKNNANSQYQVEERQNLEEKMVEIKGRYKDDFLKIITAQQLAAMYQAEGEFKNVLLEHLKKNGK